jgi:hypothetical protein
VGVFFVLSDGSENELRLMRVSNKEIHMKLSFLAAPLILLAACTANAQDRGTPPHMPVAEIASKLNVSESEAQNCFMPQGTQNQSSAQKGPKGPPSAAEQAELLNCLKAANSALTADKLDSVMQSYGPPAGGRP